MIEKLLKWFGFSVSEDTKLVLAAMEKIGSEPGLEENYRLHEKYKLMIEQARASSGRRDSKVIARAAMRLDRNRRLKRYRLDSQEIAGQLLMGERFEELGRSAMAVQGSTAAAQQHQALQQQALGSAYGSGSLYGYQDPRAQAKASGALTDQSAAQDVLRAYT